MANWVRCLYVGFLIFSAAIPVGCSKPGPYAKDPLVGTWKSKFEMGGRTAEETLRFDDDGTVDSVARITQTAARFVLICETTGNWKPLGGGKYEQTAKDVKWSADGSLTDADSKGLDDYNAHKDDTIKRDNFSPIFEATFAGPKKFRRSMSGFSSVYDRQ